MQMVVAGYLAVMYLMVLTQVSECDACSSATCTLPRCFCAGTRGLEDIVPREEIPLMLTITFDDTVKTEHQALHTRLLSHLKPNPNGCPVSATFYVSDQNETDYAVVSRLYRSGHEIASHSVSHRLPHAWLAYATYEEWDHEMNTQRMNLVEKAGIPERDIVGMRAPYLETGGDNQFQMLADRDFLYDSTFMTGPFDEGGVWPFTLDNPPSTTYCSNKICPKQSHPGVWEVPLNRWIGTDGRPCSMTDGCEVGRSKDKVLDYFWKNFYRFYRGNRAPLIMSFHIDWFEHSDVHVESFVEFLAGLQQMDDVYVLSAQQVLAWMRQPKSVHDVKYFKPWHVTCGRNSQDDQLREDINMIYPVSSHEGGGLPFHSVSIVTKNDKTHPHQLPNPTQVISVDTPAKLFSDQGDTEAINWTENAIKNEENSNLTENDTKTKYRGDVGNVDEGKTISNQTKERKRGIINPALGIRKATSGNGGTVMGPFALFFVTLFIIACG